jgi:hypothetical protein
MTGCAVFIKKLKHRRIIGKTGNAQNTEPRHCGTPNLQFHHE